MALRIGVEMVQPHIQANGFMRWFTLLTALDMDDKLGIVAVRSPDYPHSVDRLHRVEMQIPGAQQLESPSLKAIGEMDGSAVIGQLPFS